MANILGVTYKTISRWENGNYMPDISLLIPLSKELNISLKELLNNEKIIEVAENTINKKKNVIKILEVIILIMLLSVLFIMGKKIYKDNYYKNISFDENKISCVIDNDNVEITFNNYSPFQYVSNKIVDSENEYIFINGSYWYNLKRYSDNYINRNIYKEEVNNNKNIYVYYTMYNNIFNQNLDYMQNNSNISVFKKEIIFKLLFKFTNNWI